MSVDGTADWRSARAGIGLRAVGIIPSVAGLGSQLAAQLDAERERWFLWVPVAIGCGIALFFGQPTEPHLGVGLAGLAVAIVLAIVRQTGTIAIFAIGAMVWVGVGFVVAKVRSDTVAAPILERQLNNVLVEGFVELVEFRAGRGQRLTLFVTQFGEPPAAQRPYRVRVRTLAALDGLSPGQAVRLKATLSPPPPPILPGDYDFGRAAWFQRLGAVGYALRKPELIPPPTAVPWRLQFFAGVERVRRDVTLRIVTALPGESGHIAAAMITGERGGITERTNEAYRAAGTYHILSISGLHMVVMAGAIFWTIRLAFAALPGLALRVPVKKWAAVAATIAAFGYLLLSGSQPATQRSFLMIAIGFAAIVADRPAIALRTVALSAVTLLLIWPESLLDLGFQMSYAAVVSLVAVFEEVRRRRREPDRDVGPIRQFLGFFAGIVVATLIAGLATWPLSAYYFHNSQQYGVIGNMLSLPICDLLVMPAALATLIAMPLGLEWLPLAVMGIGIDAMTWIAYRVASIPGAILPVRASPDISFQMIVVGGIWLALWSTRWRLLGVGGIAIGLALMPFKPLPDIIVGREGRLVVVRGVDGLLSGLKAKGTSFELRRVLEHDGDGRSVVKVQEGAAFRCDPLGCTTTVKGERVAIVRHAAALVDDCAAASIVAVEMPRPRGCKPRHLLIDRYAAIDHGTHVITVAPGGSGTTMPVVTTVEAVRGDRPWTQGPRRTARVSRGAFKFDPASRVSAFAAPVDLGGSAQRRRLDTDDGTDLEDTVRE